MARARRPRLRRTRHIADRQQRRAREPAGLDRSRQRLQSAQRLALISPGAMPPASAPNSGQFDMARSTTAEAPRPRQTAGHRVAHPELQQVHAAQPVGIELALGRALEARVRAAGVLGEVHQLAPAGAPALVCS
jgi:hypothetical protein